MIEPKSAPVLVPASALIPAGRRERVAHGSQRRGHPPKLLFHRLGDRSSNILGAAENIGQLREEIRATSTNVGNLVHLEAPAKLLRYNRRLPPFRPTRDADENYAAIDRQYDGIVLGYANMIRNYDNLDAQTRDDAMAPMVREADWLEQTKCTIYAMGIGIQEILEPRADVIDPRLFRLLKVLNDRAAIFAVRGKATEAWLHSVGLTNAVALGCPSLFVYPRNVMATRAPTRIAPLRIATAGHIQRNAEPDRLDAINRIGAAFETSYVYQNDFYAMFRGDGDDVIYNDATGEVDGDVVRVRGRRGLGTELSFKDYWYFRSTEKWRGFTIGKDAYFGDRFHGGVIFMQCGKPAIIVQNDARVQELTALYDIPTATTAEVMAADPVDLLHDRLSDDRLRQFRATYLERYRAFHAALKAVGLEQFNEIDPDQLVGMV